MISVLESFSLMENIKKHRPAAIAFWHLQQEELSDEMKKGLAEIKSLSILTYNPYYSKVFPIDLIQGKDMQKTIRQSEFVGQLIQSYPLTVVIHPKRTYA